jgi:hypothetical protein
MSQNIETVRRAMEAFVADPAASAKVLGALRLTAPR